eukprot:8721417-Ditylum_brightwellii.AAC.1
MIEKNLNNVVVSPTVDTKDGTPVVLITIYDLKHQKKGWREQLFVLLNSGSSHSMLKASLIKKYKNKFFKKEKRLYTTAAGKFRSSHSAEVTFSFDEFAGDT